jgi:hypothetical protein
MVHRFGQEFVIAANVMQRTALGGVGLRNEEERFYFDVIRYDAERLPIYSVVGLVPLFAASIKEPTELAKLPFVTRFYEFFHGETGEGLGASHQTGGPRSSC